MKKIIALILAMMMTLTLVACGEKKDGGDKGGAASGLDMTSEELQPITDERAAADVLAEAGKYYMDGLASNPSEFAKMTYKDVKERIGVDASEFQYFESWQQYRYTWYVEGSSGPAVLAVFNSSDGTLYAVTSSVS